jgi:hypothetical protein
MHQQAVDTTIPFIPAGCGIGFGWTSLASGTTTSTEMWHLTVPGTIDMCSKHTMGSLDYGVH